MRRFTEVENYKIRCWSFEMNIYDFFFYSNKLHLTTPEDFPFTKFTGN